MIVVCLACAVVSVLLFTGSPVERRAATRLARSEPRPGDPGGRGRSAAARWALGAVALTAAAELVLAHRWAGLPGVSVAVAVLVALGTSLRLAVGARQQRSAARARVEVAHGCSVLASQIRVQDLGGDVTAVWRSDSALPGHGGLADLARAWQVSVQTGAPMACNLDQVCQDVAHGPGTTWAARRGHRCNRRDRRPDRCATADRAPRAQESESRVRRAAPNPVYHTKRLVFLDYLRTAERHSSLVQDRLLDASEPENEDGVAEEEAYRKLRDLSIEINLIAPEVYFIVEGINSLHLKLMFRNHEPENQERDFEYLTDYAVMIQDLRIEMRANLDIPIDAGDEYDERQRLAGRVAATSRAATIRKQLRTTEGH